jgi:hypothetical protein
MATIGLGEAWWRWEGYPTIQAKHANTRAVRVESERAVAHRLLSSRAWSIHTAILVAP